MTDVTIPDRFSYHEYQCRLPNWLLEEADRAHDFIGKNYKDVIVLPKKAIVAVLWEEITRFPPYAYDEIKDELISTCSRVQSKIDGRKNIYALDDEKFYPPTKILLPKDILDDVEEIAIKNYKTMTKPKSWILCLIICNKAKEWAKEIELPVSQLIIDGTIKASKRRHKVVYENE